MLLQRELKGPIDDAIDLTPMVDVVFQLLIFLMITYRASVLSEVEMPQAEYGMGVEQTEAIIITLAKPETPGGPIAVYDGASLDPEQRLDSPEAIRQAIENGLATGRRRVVLQADGAVPHGEVLRIGGIVGQVEGVGLHIGVEDLVR
jgi:biopolymer transport protein ExbD